MNLRSLMLLISVLIICFCLSLYFQSEQTVETIHLDQYKNLQYNEERSHSLVDFNKKILPHKLEETLKEMYDRNRKRGHKTRVMEIGVGNGRVLMELKKLFPEIEFYGINKEKTHTFYRRESYILTALKFEIFKKEEIDGMDLPYLIFQDVDFGTKIPYGDNKFDLIFSQNTVSYIKYKFELFNEIMRILKPEGLSFHSDVSGINIYKKGVVLEIKDALNELGRRGMSINTLDNRSTIRFKKLENNILFPLTPHQPMPVNIENVPLESRWPQMGYNLN